PWREGWAVEPVGSRVAWLEMAPPPGDWSRRLPHGCCGSDPAPKPEAIAVWDGSTGQMQRFPVSNYSWSVPGVAWMPGEKLRWAQPHDYRDLAVYYTTHPGPSDPATMLYRLDLNGKSTLLDKQEPYGGIKVVA